jgi:molecular chaperone Hsp33
VSEIHKFLFEGVPVRGVLVRLTDAWTEILRRRAGNSTHGAFPPAVQQLLGEMTAAAILMQSNIKFDGALVLQLLGDGPVKLAVVEVQPGLGLRATATVNGDVAADASLSQMVNLGRHGRCAITLDPQNRQPGQQPYQGVVPLVDSADQALEKFSDVLQHYMHQSEQLDTTLVLAADDKVAAGLLIQRLPSQGSGNLAGQTSSTEALDQSEDYRRIALLAASLKRDELLMLDADTVLHRLFWQEDLRRFDAAPGAPMPHFACSCSRDRVSKMLVGLGAQEARSILQETQVIEVGCDFCGVQYRFDSVDVEQLFHQPDQRPPSGAAIH